MTRLRDVLTNFDTLNPILIIMLQNQCILICLVNIFFTPRRQGSKAGNTSDGRRATIEIETPHKKRTRPFLLKT